MINQEKFDIVAMLHKMDKKLDLVIARSEAHEVLDNERFASVNRTIGLMSAGAAIGLTLIGVIVAIF